MAQKRGIFDKVLAIICFLRGNQEVHGALYQLGTNSRCSIMEVRVIIAMQLVFFVIRTLFKRRDNDNAQLTWILIMCCTMYLARLFFHKAPAATLEYIAGLAFSLLLSFFFGIQI